MYVDFHTHTIASDGRLTPEDLVTKAKSLGFSFIAKTDHDTVELTEEFLKAGEKHKLNTIPGIEVSSRYKDHTLHITGLGIDHHNKKLLAYTRKCTRARRKRGLDMTKKLKKHKWKIDQSHLEKNTITRPDVALAVIDHPDNKTRLIEEFGKIPSFSEFIQSYLVSGEPCYAPKKYYIKPLDAIRVIHSAGGLAIIAHPSCKTKEFNYSEKHLLQIIEDLPFDGLEVYNHDATTDEITSLLKIAKDKNLLISAGSDYHGYDAEFPLGICNAGDLLSVDACQPLLTKLGY